MGGWGMTSSVTLTWDDDDAAPKLLEFRSQLNGIGYISDSDGDWLQGLVAASKVDDAPARGR
jgi:hypothetical protein